MQHPREQKPVNIASPDVTAAIKAIEPSRTPHNESFWPCELVLDDGHVVPRVICRENARWSDKGEWINPERIIEVRPSSRRLPAALAKKLYSAGESGMGYLIYLLELRSGETLACCSGGIVDFPDLPEGIRTNDIVDVHPHESRDRTIHNDADFAWCDFVPHDKYS
jgi:hypothetical protein